MSSISFPGATEPDRSVGSDINRLQANTPERKHSVENLLVSAPGCRHAKHVQESGDFQTDFGQRVRTLRERAGLPQEEVAHRMGLSSSSYARIERGQQAMRTNRLPALVAALESSLQEFFAPL